MQILLLVLGLLFLVAGFMGGKARSFKTPALNASVRGGLVFVGGLVFLLTLTNWIVFDDFSDATSPRTANVAQSEFTNNSDNTTRDTISESNPNQASQQKGSPLLQHTTNSTPTSSSTSLLASIVSPENFVTCSQVNKRNPEFVSEVFSYGRVYAWARVFAPREEVLTLKWYAADNRVLKSKRITIGKNIGDGYRIYDYKQFHSGDDGVYYLKLFNSSQELIGTRQFRIDGEYAGRR